jgi:hypothetical protein
LAIPAWAIASAYGTVLASAALLGWFAAATAVADTEPPADGADESDGADGPDGAASGEPAA